MKKLMKKEYRALLANNHALRYAIGFEVKAHQQTIQRWAVNNNPKLALPHFLKAFRKHSGIDKSVELTEQVAITQPHEVVA